MIPLRDRVPSLTFPAVTLALIGANLVVFLVELSLPADELRALFDRLALVPARLAGLSAAVGEAGRPTAGFWSHVQPLLTSMFLHGGWLHLIANMWVLWLFGDNVEDRMGHLRFLLFYLLCGVVAGLLHAAFNLSSHTPTVGASGAIAGVMGAYVLMFPGARIFTLVPILIIPLFVNIPAVIFIGFWFLTQLFSGVTSIAGAGSQGGIAWWGHIGGFAFGAISLPLFRRRGRDYPRDDSTGWRRDPRRRGLFRRASPRGFPWR